MRFLSSRVPCVRALLACLAAWLILAGCATPPNFDDAKRLEAQGQLVEALLAYERVLPSLAGPDRAAAEGEVQRLRRAIAEKAIAAARDAAGAGDTFRALLAARERLRAAQPYDDATGRVAGAVRENELALAELHTRHDRALAQADTAADAERWIDALNLLTVAEKISEDTLATGPRRTKWLGQRDDSVAATVRTAVTARDLDGAEKLLARFAAAQPPPPESLVAQLRGEVLDLRHTLFLEAQQALAKEQRYLEAYRNLLTADWPAAREYLEIVRRDGANYYLGVARKELNTVATRLGYAYFAATKAKELNGEQDDVFKLHRDISDLVENLITVRIAVSGFDSPVAVPGIGNQVSDALIAYLVDHLPHGIEVLERSKIDRLLTERGRELKELSDDLKVEMFIIGNVSVLDIERKRSEREVTEVVKVGTHKEPNPLYQQMVTKHGLDTSRWPVQTPALIDGAPIMETIRYKQGEEVLNGIMVTSVRVFEAAKGAISVAREFRASENLKDTFCDAVPIAGIKYKPLQLPADNEVRERLRAQLVQKIADVILLTYAEREKRYLDAASAYLQRREPEKAVIELACAHHYAVIAPDEIKDGAKNASVQRVNQLGLFDLTH